MKHDTHRNFKNNLNASIEASGFNLIDLSKKKQTNLSCEIILPPILYKVPSEVNKGVESVING